MTRPNIQIDDEVREMTEEEYAELLTSGWNEEGTDIVAEDVSTQIQSHLETKASASAKLAALGLTEEEIKAIIGGA